MQPQPPWGGDDGLLDRYALADAEAVVRLLLPARRRDDDRPMSWHQVAASYRYPLDIDGSTSWSALTQLPGDGSWQPEVECLAPSGRMSEDVLDLLRRVLPEAVRPSARWRVGPTIGQAFVGTNEGSFSGISVGWTTTGFPGRAWSSDFRVGLAAPPYADSVIISVPATVRQTLLDSGLEVFPVSRRARDPITAE